jgi:Tol biopolymer transport system component
MKMSFGLAAGFIFLCIISAAQQSSTEFPKLTGPYLGQKPPGMVPEVFAPGVVSTAAHEFSCSFTPDGKEFYFTRRDPTINRPFIMVTQLRDGVWTEPVVATFSENRSAFEPRVTPDGSRLYFTSEKPISGHPDSPMNIWYVEREGEQWSGMKNPGDAFNPMKSMYISSTMDGTIYASDISDGPGSEGIAAARRVNGEYQKFEKLGGPINLGAQDMYPYVAPDEGYLIFNSKRPAGNINSGMFISWRRQDGTWSEPRAIDLGMNAGLPLVSPDGKYLFFTAGERGKSDIYWVSAKIIEALKPKK